MVTLGEKHRGCPAGLSPLAVVSLPVLLPRLSYISAFHWVSSMIEVKSVRDLTTLVSSAPFLLVDVYATWCVPCKWMASALENLYNELSQMGFKIAKVNVDEVDIGRATDELKLEPIRGVPTLLIFKNGKEVGRVVGALPKPDFPQELKRRIIEALEKQTS